MKIALRNARVENANLRAELNTAKEGAAEVNQNLVGTIASLQLQLATSSKSQQAQQYLGLTSRQEDAICRGWEDIIEEIKATNGEHLKRVANDLRLARAIATDLNEQLAAQHAVFHGKAQAPNILHDPTDNQHTDNQHPTPPRPCLTASRAGPLHATPQSRRSEE